MKRGFSLAEALITLMIVSLILAAVIPVMSKKQNTVDSMWRYASNNSDIYFANSTSQTAVIGSNTVPASSKGSRLLIATPEDSASNKTIRRSLIDFYQNTSSGTTNIGRIAFEDGGDDTANEYPLLGSIAIGKESLINSTGDGNTALGCQSLKANTTGSINTAIGFQSLKNNTEGWHNTAVGNASMKYNSTGSENTAVGMFALMYSTTGINNSAFGDASMYQNTIGSDNTALGTDSLRLNILGSNNVAVGSESLLNNLTSLNVGVGYRSLQFNTTGTQNTAVGSFALQGSTPNNSGDANVAVGTYSLVNNTGYQNTAIGQSSMPTKKNGNQNTALGHATMLIADGGSNNTAMGVAALYRLTSGSNNTAVGSWACDMITEGTNNVCLGLYAGPTSNQSNKLYIDYTRTDNPLIYGDFVGRSVKINGALSATTVTQTSDSRVKNIGEESKIGLEKILKLKIRNYTFKDKDTSMDKRKHTGVIAQELQKIIPNAVVEGPGNEKYKKLLYVDQSEILFACVNAIKQLYSKIVATNNRIDILKKENTKLQEQLLQAKKTNKTNQLQLNKQASQINSINQKLLRAGII